MNWHERPTVTIAEAVAISGLSRRKLRSYVAERVLDVVELPKLPGRARADVLVKVPSLMRLLGVAHGDPQVPAVTRDRADEIGRSALGLVGRERPRTSARS